MLFRKMTAYELNTIKCGDEKEVLIIEIE